MSSQITFKSVLLDFLFGFIAFCLTIVCLFLARLDGDPRAFLGWTAFIFMLAGATRSKSNPQNPLLKGLLVTSGGLVPAIAIDTVGLGFTDPLILTLYIGVSLAFTACGVLIGRRRRTGGAKQWLLISIASLAIVIILVGALLPRQIVTISRTQLNLPAPAFNISTLDNQTIHSRNLRDKVVVLAFWATWCAPCRAEMPKLAELHAHYKNNPKVSFWMVDAGWSGDTVEKARAYLTQNGLDLPCVFSSYRTDFSLGVLSIPKVIILDQAGYVRLVHTGYDDNEPLAANFSRVIDGLLGSDQ